MARKNPVKELTNYAIEYGKWLKEHEDEEGKVLTKKLAKDDRLTKQSREHYIEDNSAVLDRKLEKYSNELGDSTREKLLSIRDELFNGEYSGDQRTWQREAINVFLKKLGLNLE